MEGIQQGQQDYFVLVISRRLSSTQMQSFRISGKSSVAMDGRYHWSCQRMEEGNAAPTFACEQLEKTLSRSNQTCSLRNNAGKIKLVAIKQS